MWGSINTSCNCRARGFELPAGVGTPLRNGRNARPVAIRRDGEGAVVRLRGAGYGRRREHVALPGHREAERVLVVVGASARLPETAVRVAVVSGGDAVRVGVRVEVDLFLHARKLGELRLRRRPTLAHEVIGIGRVRSGD